MKKHELRDANIRSIVIFGVGLAVLVGVSLLIMGWLFGYLAGREEPSPPLSPLAQERVVPHSPRLQVTPATDLERLRSAEDAVLASYAWVDKEAGIVRIPIDRAMDLLVEKGLKTRDNAGQRK